MVHTFTMQEHEDHGYTGWVLDSKPYFDPMDGMGVAHDVLEEFPRGKDQPHDELLAMGALIFGRGEMWSHNCSLVETVAHECSGVFRHVFHEEGYSLAFCYPSRPFEDDLIDYENTIQAVVEHIVKINTLDPTRGYDNREYDDAESEKVLGEVENIRNWLRLGIRKARRRFRNLEGYDVAQLFERIEKEVNRVTKQAELGDKLSIRVSYKRNDVEIWHREPSRSYWG